MRRRHILRTKGQLTVLALAITLAAILILYLSTGRPSPLMTLGISAFCAYVGFILAFTLRIRYRKLLELKLYNDYILHSITRGVITVGLDGKVRLINRAAFEILELDESAAAGTDYAKLLGDKPVLKSLISDVLEREQIVEDKEIECVTSSGRRLTLQLNTAVLRDSEGQAVGAILLIKDLSEMKLLQSRIRRADTLAALGRITASLAHEIKNPLSGISINLELLEETLHDEKLENGEEVREYIKVIAGEIKRLEDLVKNLSRFVKPPTMRLETLDLNDVLNRVLNLVKIEARDQGIEIVRRFGRIPPTLGDMAQLQQAFLNLIINAIEAMPQGGKLTVTTRWDEPHNLIKASISDTGVGMHPEEQDRVFEFYYTTKENGTGMGLPIALKIIKDHGGDIDLESQVGVGTTFTVILPVRGEGNGGQNTDS
ncbi:PAS domain-containing protein [Candidatus Poribacteria bacterium]|nr:PAS domain-containing protein [Candidatus Poribacteria bacterium]